MKTSYLGFNNQILTFKADSGVTVGTPVKVAASGVQKADDTEAFIGVCTSLREGAAGVQCCGYVETKYTESAPTLGWSKLVSNGVGGVKTGGEVAYRVIYVDEASTTVGFIM